MSADATFDILIQIRDEIAGLNRTREGLTATKKEAAGLGEILKQGLGIGSGMAIANGAIGLLRNSLRASVGEAINFASQVKNVSEALGMSAAAYQVLRLEFADAGMDASRLNEAISNQTRSLAEARDATSATAEAYRRLGLDAAAVELLPVEERILAVTRATMGAKDQTQAFSDAAAILGNRGLPAMLHALTRLGTEGFTALQKQYEAQGLILGDETMARLEDAQNHWERLWHRIVIGSGEALGGLSLLAELLKKDFWGTVPKMLMGFSGPVGAGLFAADLAANATPMAKPKAGVDHKAIADAQARTAAASAAALALVAAEKAVAKSAADAVAHQTALREGAGATTQALMRQGQAITAAVRTPWEEYADKMVELDQLNRTFHEGVQALSNEDYGRAAGEAYRIAEEKSRVGKNGESAPDPFQNWYQPPEGLQGGAESFLTNIGTTAQQTAQILESSLGAALDSISRDIWEVVKGTGSWSDAFRNLGDIAGRMLTQMITQMIVMQTLQTALGIFGFGINYAPTGAASIGRLPVTGAGAGAGGGSFMTHGRAQLIVGDNPGGIEHVQVTPLSGIGQSWSRGTMTHMGGGGSLLAGDLAGRGAESKPTVIQNIYVSTGVQATVRAEILGMLPQLRASSVAAVEEAMLRNRVTF